MESSWNGAVPFLPTSYLTATGHYTSIIASPPTPKRVSTATPSLKQPSNYFLTHNSKVMELLFIHHTHVTLHACILLGLGLIIRYWIGRRRFTRKRITRSSALLSC